MARAWTVVVRPLTFGAKRWRMPPSLNGRMHWRQRSAIARGFKSVVWAECKELKIPRLKRARVTMTNFTCQPKDRDNLFGSVKPLIDAVVLAGVLEDDREEFCDLFCRNERVAHRSDERLTLTIEELQT